MALFAGGWRNGLLFDPLQQYGNYSYADVMLYPLAAALSQAADADTKIYMAMQVCEGPWKGSTLQLMLARCLHMMKAQSR